MNYLYVILFLASCTPKLSPHLSLPSTDLNTRNDLSSTPIPESESEPDEIITESSNALAPPSLIMINEILYDASGDEVDGNIFIELYGTPGGSLAGYSIEIIDGTTEKVVKKIILDQNHLVNDKGYFVLCDAKTGSVNESNIAFCQWVGHFDTQNGPDVVVLMDDQSSKLDILCYGFKEDDLNQALCPYGSAIDVTDGASLSRVNSLNTLNNSNDFIALEAPTPGAEAVSEPMPVTQLDQAETLINPDKTSADETVIAGVITTNTSPYFGDVRITEVVCDPQHDWNDSEGGNNIPFDAFFGSGTVGSTDEWIELKNISSQTINLTDWVLQFNDGTDELFVFKPEDEAVLFSNDASADKFDHQDLLVITDIPGDMKNKINLILLDEEELIVDEVFIEDANSNSFDDESVVMDLDKNISKKASTILF